MLMDTALQLEIKNSQTLQIDSHTGVIHTGHSTGLDLRNSFVPPVRTCITEIVTLVMWCGLGMDMLCSRPSHACNYVYIH